MATLSCGIFTWIIVSFLLLTAVQAKLNLDNLSDRLVSTKFGRLRGVLVEFEDSGLQSVEAYLGVEYGSLHGGALRFMPPSSPQEKWEGVKLANTFRPVCPQKALQLDKVANEMPTAHVERLKRIAEFTKSQSEDCLFLNIYIPSRERSEPAPVLVIIHGESYEFGTGNAYDGSVLAAQADITVVTLNYRLGPLGFLSTGDRASAGNFALFDLVAALHWIQTNIADFGGDSTKVTVLGQGRGAALANLLSLAPIAKRMNLFHRMILQSGSALASWSMAANPMRTAVQLAENFDCRPPTVDDEPINMNLLVKCLRDVPAEGLMNANVTDIKFLSTYGPVVDKVILHLDPYKLMEKDDTLFADIEVLFGVAMREGGVLLSQKELEEGVTSHQKLKLARTYVRNTYRYHHQEILNILTHHYNDWEGEAQEPNQEHKQQLIDMFGDGQYAVPAVTAGRHHLDHQRDTYFYVFSHSSGAEDFPNYQGGQHGDEMPFLLGAPVTGRVMPFSGEFTKSEKVLSEAVIKFWGNFVKSGNPNIPITESTPSILTIDSLRFMDVYWPRYDRTTQKYLQLGTRPLINHHYRSDKIALWTELIPKLHAHDDSLGHHNQQTASDDTRLVDVRHVELPPPPSPPIQPPFRKNSTVFTRKPSNDEAKSSTKPSTPKSVVIAATAKPVTRIMERIIYRNTTRVVTRVVPVYEQKQEKMIGKLSMSLAVTLGVGCALMFLNAFILIGVCYQRSRLRAERKQLQKLKVAEGKADPEPASGSGHNTLMTQQQVALLESHLYEKAMETFERMHNKSQPNGRLANHGGDNGSIKSQSGGSLQSPSRGTAQSRFENEYEPETFPPPPESHYAVVDKTGRRSRTPSSGSVREDNFDNNRDRNRSLKRPARQGQAPIPRQRTSESLTRLADGALSDAETFSEGRSPRRDISRRDLRDGQPSQTPRDGRRNFSEEIASNTPRRLFSASERQDADPRREELSPRQRMEQRNGNRKPYRMSSEDGVSSDSGVQHMTYAENNLSVI